MRGLFALFLVGCSGQVATPDASIEASVGDGPISDSPNDASPPDADAGSQVHARFVAVDDQRLWWTDVVGASGIGWAMKDGSSSGTLPAVGCGTVNGISVDDVHVFLACRPGPMRIDKTGSSPNPYTFKAVYAVASTSACNGQPCFNRYDATTFLGSDVGLFAETGTVGLLLGQVAAFAIGVDDRNFFWSEWDPANACGAPVANIGWGPYTGMKTSIGTGRVAPFGIASNGSVVVWSDVCAHTLMKRAFGGDAGMTTAMLASGDAVTGAVVADSKYAYTLSSVTHVVSSVSLSDGTVTALATVSGAGPNLAQDAMALYVAGATSIVRIPKP